MRDPYDPGRDTYSPLEAAAVEYAVRQRRARRRGRRQRRQGAPREPWELRQLPGGAAARDRGQRDRARRHGARLLEPRSPSTTTSPLPARTIFSTLPRALTQDRVHVLRCRATRTAARLEFRRGEGTSFAAPQVAAAAARPPSASDPQLRPDQVAARSRRARPPTRTPTRAACAARSAATRSPAGACSTSRRRSAHSTLPLPDADRFEPNDERRDRRSRSGAARASGSRRRSTTGTTRSTSTSVKLRRGQRLVARRPRARAARTRISSSGSPARQRVGGAAADPRLPRRAVHVARLGRADPATARGRAAGTTSR